MPYILNLKKARLLVPFIILMFFSGCSKPDDIPVNNYRLRSNYRLNSEERDTDDPFAIKNIRRAYRNLQAVDSSIPEVEIRPNHLYLRFIPGDAAELELLRNDTTLVLFDHPLSVEVSEDELGNDTLDDNSVMYQYCVVPDDKILPPVPHEVIYEVFIPSTESSTVRSSVDELSGFYEKLVNESARITGNLPEADSSVYQLERSSQRWTPRGRIRVWDDLLNMYIPLNHVNVHARWFTRVETCLTNEEGYFRMKSFRYRVNYSIKWENSLFTIRDGLLKQAWYNGPRKTGDWMLDIEGGKSKMFATIHRAAYRHFYGNNLGLFRPTLRTGGRTRICYMEGNGTGQFLGDFSLGGIIPDIQVWGNENKKLTNSLYGTVTHELGHQIHSQYVGNLRFFKSSKIIRESWAEAVEWALTNEEYHELGKKYGKAEAMEYDHQYNMHAGWPLVQEVDYSPVFIDLIDTRNQRLDIGPGHPNDLISQYSISFINSNLLINSTDISSLKQEISKHKLEGVDDFKINELFLLY